MRVSLRAMAAASLAVLAAGPAIAAGNRSEIVYSTASYADRLENVEAQLAALHMPSSQASTSTCTSCGGSSCTSCCGADGGGVYAGYSFVFARPCLPQPTVLIDTSPNLQNHYTNVSLDFDRELSPRIWMGWVGCNGLGLRASYWQFDHAGNAQTLTGPGEVIAIYAGGAAEEWDLREGDLDITFGLELHSVELEATQQFNFCSAAMILSGGVRYARVVQEYRAVHAYSGEVSGIDDFQATHAYDGFGPTVALELHRPIGCRGLGLFGKARGSVLFGDVATDIRNLSYSVPGTALQSSDDYLTYHGDNAVGVGEIQIGVEWDHTLRSGTGLIVRAGYEGQIWDGIGSPTNSEGGGAPLAFEGLILDLGLRR